MLNLDGARVTVMGLGRFDGGLGVTRWLAGRGARITVTDTADAEALRATTDRLRDLVERGVVALRLGGHDERDFTDADLVVANPAVPRPWENRFLAAARGADVPVTTEIRLLVERLDRRRVVGVTGTAGKSTTAAMIHHVLAAEPGRRAHLGGNIGGSLLPDLETIGPDDWVVLELSSAMLHWLGPDAGGPGWSPRVAVLTNVAPNHLDWHGTFEHYCDAKHNVHAFRRPGDALVRGDIDPPAPPAGLALTLPGAHNRSNAALAIEAARRAIGVPRDEAARRLASFTGLPHRLALVADTGPDGVRAYDDSKSTTPEAACLAVAAFDDAAHVHLIAGGHDKGVDLSPVAALAADLAGLYTIGATGDAIADAAPDGAPVHRCGDLDRAVQSAAARATPGDVILLSPACASWDQFDNYEARGARFTELVQAALSRPRAGVRA